MDKKPNAGLMLGAGENVYRFISIDPGTDTLGLARWTVDTKTGVGGVDELNTFKASKRLALDNSYQQLADLHGERTMRLIIIGKYLYHEFLMFKPHHVVSETPFMMDKKGVAFEALVEGMMTIRRSLFEYSKYMTLDGCSPGEAKASVGIGNLKKVDKNDIYKAVLKLHKEKKFIYNDINLSIEDADEHSIDAIAVGYSHLLHIQSELGVR